MSTIRMYKTGKNVDPFDLQPDDVHIDDIAWGLANMPRYAAQTRRVYSVAEHCLLVVSFLRGHPDIVKMPEPLRRKAMLTGLMHDASEAYLLDMPKPLKERFPEYQKVELDVEIVIAEKFDLFVPGHIPAIKEIDIQVRDHEKANLRDGKEHNLRMFPMAHNPVFLYRKFLDAFEKYGGVS